jgi:hypothetical protein
MAKVRKTGVAVLATIGVMACGRLASAGQATSLTIGVRVVNNAGTPDRTVAAAMKEVTGQYRHAGLTLRWVKDSSAADPNASPSWQAYQTADVRLILQIADSAAVAAITDGDTARAARSTSVLGRATGTFANPGCLAYIFYDRVRTVMHRQRIDERDERYVLGTMIAHELGHLLNLEHSDSGVMTGGWDDEQFALAADDSLRFSRAQAELMRNTVSTARAKTDWCAVW